MAVASTSLASQLSGPKSLSQSYSGLRRSCPKLDHSHSHSLFQHLHSHLTLSSSRKPSRAVVSMAGTGKVNLFSSFSSFVAFSTKFRKETKRSVLSINQISLVRWPCWPEFWLLLFTTNFWKKFVFVDCWLNLLFVVIAVFRWWKLEVCKYSFGNNVCLLYL